MPTGRDGDVTKPHVIFDPNYNPFTRSPKAAVNGWEKLYPPRQTQPTMPVQPQAEITESNQLFDTPLSDITPYKYGGKYLILPSTTGLMLVNYHRAHIKVLYEQYLKQMNVGKGVSQQLLFPEVVDLTQDDIVLLESIIEELRFVGFELEQFSKNAYSVSGIPALLNSQDVQTALLNILHTVRETGTSATDHWRKQIALSLAKDTAIPYGKNLSDEESKHLLDQLFTLPDYRRTPDGKPICVILSDDELTRKFA